MDEMKNTICHKKRRKNMNVQSQRQILLNSNAVVQQHVVLVYKLHIRIEWRLASPFFLYFFTSFVFVFLFIFKTFSSYLTCFMLISTQIFALSAAFKLPVNSEGRTTLPVFSRANVTHCQIFSEKLAPCKSNRELWLLKNRTIFLFCFKSSELMLVRKIPAATFPKVETSYGDV